jgi:sodium-dependent phosphate cotransporter
LNTQPVIEKPQQNLRETLRIVLNILAALLLFLFAIDLMVSSLQHLGKNVVETIILATANPFTGLFIGLLITAMIQSSSTTTALAVALVASGSLTLQSAVPIIMGANVGTTITSTIVSLGFINKRKEFRRAVAAGTYHCFFNLLTVFILFPLEYYYGFLSSLSERIANYFFVPSSIHVENKVTHVWNGFNPIVDFLVHLIPNGFVLIILSFVLLFGSILIFRKLISDLLEAKSPEAFSRFFFKNPFKSFSWGLLTTAAIRSSTITTSVVVPIVAKKIATLRQAAPFIMGANVGTTITAFIAAMLNANTSGAISIAIAHFLFNFIGVILFFVTPVLQKLPIELANGLGKLTLRFRLVGFLFLLMTFFFIPFSLIYFNQDTIKTKEMTYEHYTSGNKSYYRISSRINTRSQSGEWRRFEGKDKAGSEEASIIFPVFEKNNTLFIGKEMYLFNKPGFCWDGEEGDRKYKACVQQILPQWKADSGLPFDSVYICDLRYDTEEHDSLVHRIYLSAEHKVILKRETFNASNELIEKDEVVQFDQE